jgi:K+-transporting ATPase ATPase C chain
MLVNLRRSLVFAVIAIIGTLAYALIGTGVSQVLFKGAANGSLTANGSTLIGQNWAATSCPGHQLGSSVFHGRPHDTGPYAAVACAASAKNCSPAPGGDNPLVANGSDGESAATNLGPRSAKLRTYTEELVAYWHKLGVVDPTPDLVTTSGSGYDPDITATDALVQVPMVANATGVSAAALRQLITEETHGAQLGFLGSSYIDVLQLNEALAKLK